MTTGPNLTSPSVTGLEEPLVTPTPFPVTGHSETMSFFSDPRTLVTVSHINAKQFALEAYMSARAAARYRGSLLQAKAVEGIGMFLDIVYEDMVARSYLSRRNAAFMVPSWVADHLESTGQRCGVPLIEIPMRPTAPVWEAVGVATRSRIGRLPQLVTGHYEVCGRYPYPALPEHLEDFAVIEKARAEAAEHKRKYEALAKPTPEQQAALAENVREEIAKHEATSDE